MSLTHTPRYHVCLVNNDLSVSLYYHSSSVLSFVMRCSLVCFVQKEESTAPFYSSRGSQKDEPKPPVLSTVSLAPFGLTAAPSVTSHPLQPASGLVTYPRKPAGGTDKPQAVLQALRLPDDLPLPAFDRALAAAERQLTGRDRYMTVIDPTAGGAPPHVSSRRERHVPAAERSPAVTQRSLILDSSATLRVETVREHTPRMSAKVKPVSSSSPPTLRSLTVHVRTPRQTL